MTDNRSPTEVQVVFTRLFTERDIRQVPTKEEVSVVLSERVRSDGSVQSILHCFSTSTVE